MNLTFFTLLAVQASSDAEILIHEDPYGLIMTMIGLSIVFGSLVLIYFVFSKTRILFTFSFRQKFKNFFSMKKKDEGEAPVTISHDEELSGEVNAAIAAAIHLYRSELHDFENTVLTIKKVSRTYSPWSSKIYGLRNPLSN